MDIIKMTRDLGAAIQQDERYLRFAKARENNEKDEELLSMMGQIQQLQMSYQQEAAQENADSAKMAVFERQFNDVYAKFMANENMKEYEVARHDIDELMNYLMQILGLCVNGADPATCEPEVHEHSCDCDCDSCHSGCC